MVAHVVAAHPQRPAAATNCLAATPRLPKDRYFLQPGKTGRLLRSVATIPERKQHPRGTSAGTAAPMPGGLSILNSIKSNQSKNQRARRQRAAARAVVGRRHPGGHRDAPIRSLIRQTSGGREVPANHRPRARPSDQLPVRVALPARRGGVPGMHDGGQRGSGLLECGGKGRSPQRCSRCGHQARDPRRCDAGIKAVQEVVTIVEAKEAAQDAVATGRSAQAATSSTYKNNRRKYVAAFPPASLTKRKMLMQERLQLCRAG